MCAPAPPSSSRLVFACRPPFGVEGTVTGFGNPDWRSTHSPSEATAPVVLTVVNAGATCVGKTHMAELAYSITGEDEHYGTPVNPAAPGHQPGGSSSGSAVAVAAGLVDFSLGTDTVGSMRIPAANCGILGFRPSHGVISSEGVIPMSPSLDTVGWFARDPAVLRQVGNVLLAELPQASARNAQKIFVAEDCFALCNSTYPSAILMDAIASTSQKVYSTGAKVLRIDLGLHLSKNVPSLEAFQTADSSPFFAIREATRQLQGYEFRCQHGKWLDDVNPKLGKEIQSRVKATLDIAAEAAEAAQSVQEELRKAMADLLKEDALLVMPTAPGPPPKLRAKAGAMLDFRNRAMNLLAPGSLSGCPVISIPAGTEAGHPGGLPVAISVVARHGNDRLLLDSAHLVHGVLLQEVKYLWEKSKSRLKGGRSKEDAAEDAKDKGNEAYKANSYEKALGFYSEAIRLDPKRSTYYSNRAMCQLNLNNFAEAEADCTAALKLDKKNVKAILRRATARDFLGYYDDAVEDFRQALIYEPTNRTARDGLHRLTDLLHSYRDSLSQQ
eukprot:SM000019S05006  [mRNA]  locus=s19:460014:464021:- [translate_table: standard]